MTVLAFAAALGERFLDPSDGPGPTCWDFFSAFCSHPGARANGYLISNDRPDYGMVIDYIDIPNASDIPTTEQKRLCAGAEQSWLGSTLTCRWD